MTELKAALTLCEKPDEYFSFSVTNMFSLEREDLEDMQLKVLQARHEQLREKIPVLSNLIKGTGVDSIEKLEDVVPLLFKHTMYKSYPPSLLERNRFESLNQWLNKLTTHDITGVDVSGCESIDQWIDVLDKETPLRIGHSSGTTGVVSFLPLEGEDYRRNVCAWPVTFMQEFGGPQIYDGTCPKLHCVDFNYRHSRRTSGRLTNYIRDYFGGSEERYHAAYPGTMSSDLLYLAGKIRAAQAKGNIDSVNVGPALLARKEEFARLYENEKAMRKAFFERITGELAGQRVFITSIMTLLYEHAKEGLEKGFSNLFSPDSVLFTGGGAKGMVLAADWKDTVREFTGIKRIGMGYGMSEVMALHPMCDHDHYHILPFVLPFALDPDTGEMLPRTGETTGRAAFFDLGCSNRWGGFISGDEITVNWDEPCPCGMKGAYILGDIERYSEKQGGDDKINCAMTAKAQDEALEFLLDL